MNVLPDAALRDVALHSQSVGTARVLDGGRLKSAFPFLGLQFIGLVLCMYSRRSSSGRPSISSGVSRTGRDGRVLIEAGSGAGLRPHRDPVIGNGRVMQSGRRKKKTRFFRPGAVCGGLLRAPRPLDRRHCAFIWQRFEQGGSGATGCTGCMIGFFYLYTWFWSWGLPPGSALMPRAVSS